MRFLSHLPKESTLKEPNHGIHCLPLKVIFLRGNSFSCDLVMGITMGEKPILGRKKCIHIYCWSNKNIAVIFCSEYLLGSSKYFVCGQPFKKE